MLNFRIEKRLEAHSGKIVLGMDEVGRGPIAGPVAVGAVLIDSQFLNCLRKNEKWWREVNDSKKLTAKEREKIYRFVCQKVPHAVGMASARYIDRHGIVAAVRKAARLALKKLEVKPGIILQDGNRQFLKVKNCSQRTIVNGDGRLWSIACASIAAKVSRDSYMKKAGRRYPQYNFSQHKGYGTKSHINLLWKHGPCRFHRFSFAPLKNRGFQRPFSRDLPENVRK